LKILALSNLYPPDFLGGYEIACAQLVDALRARGHEVLVASAAPRHPVPSLDHVHVRRVFRLVDEWNVNGIGNDRFVQELRSAESRLINAVNIHALTSLLGEFGPDVVFVHNLIGLGGLGLMACLQFLDIPWVWQLGDCVPRDLCSKLWVYDQVIPTLAEQFSRRLNGYYIVVSQQLRDEIESAGIVLSGTVEVIPNGITGVQGEPRRTFYRDGSGPLRIISAGQVSREKGIHLLIQAAGQLRDAGYPNFSVEIFGPIDDPSFGCLIRELGLVEQVRLMGIRPHREVRDAYGRYDVLAFPTHHREPFGLVPLEAAARGCVPLITRRCGVAEWLVHGVHCLKVDRSAEGFAAAFRSIMDGQVELEPIARRGEAAVWRDFHLDALLPRIESVLAAAAARPLQARARAGTVAEVYRMARMAEQLTHVLIQEAIPA
jgi:glycosyltransferase involved in cell wall biosynthesis